MHPCASTGPTVHHTGDRSDQWPLKVRIYVALVDIDFRARREGVTVTVSGKHLVVPSNRDINVMIAPDPGRAAKTLV